MAKKIVIGSRGSILAMAQSEMIKKRLEANFPEIEFEIKKIVTSGDTDLVSNWNNSDKSLKSFFTKEIEVELLNGTIDLAVQDINEKSKCIRNLRYEKKKKGSRVQGYVFYYDYVDPNEFRPNYTKAIESDRTVNNAEQMELEEFLKEFE